MAMKTVKPVATIKKTGAKGSMTAMKAAKKAGYKKLAPKMAAKKPPVFKV